MKPAVFSRAQSGLTWRILAVGAGIIIVLIALAAFRLWQDRIHALEDSDQIALERAGTISAGISATLQAGEVVLDYTSQATLEQLRDQSRNMALLPQRLIALAEPLAFIQSVGFIAAPGSKSYTVVRNENGNLITRISDADFRNRDTYAVHATRPRDQAQLFLSDVREGYVTGTPIVLISKGIWDDNGKFVGIAAVGIRVEALRQIVSSVVPTANGSIAVLRLDGKLLLSEPEGLDRLGRLPPQSNFYGERLRAAPNTVYVTPTSADGIERRVAYSAAQRYPVVSVVSTPSATALESWTRAATITAIAMAFGILLISILTAWLIQGDLRQRKAQRELQNSEQRFRDMLECSSDYIWETDANEIVTVFEGTGTEFYPQIVGKFGGEFVAATSQPSDLEKVLEHVRTRTPYRNLFIPAKGIDGELRWARTSANPKFDADGQYAGFRGVGSDVTEFRRARQSLEDQRKTEALARLASGMAHEINNLLQPILIYSGFGSADQVGDVRDTYFAKIRRAAESASHIVRNALSFTRRAQPHRDAVNVGQSLHDTIELITSLISNEITINIDHASLDRWVLVDRTGLTQVLMNLLTNAIESLSSHELKERWIEISAYDDNGVCLVIADNGPGIAPENLPNVFDPFFTTKAQGQGTGLGLSVVSGLVRSWGGRITVTSKPFERTAFVMVLPAAQPQIQAAQ